MRIVLLVFVTLALAELSQTAEAAKSDAKNSAACKSFHSDMRHKGGGYIPAGMKCGKKKRR